MKIHIRQITRNGYDQKLGPKETWFMSIMHNLFPNGSIDLDSLKGNVHLENLSGNIHLSGHVEFTHHPLCARCGTELTRHENINLTANMVPVEAMTGEDVPTEEEEKELTADDVDFAFFENEEVEIDPIVNDEIALALPYNYYCEDSVRCQKDGQTLAQHHTAGNVDPRLAVLKNFKVKS